MHLQDAVENDGIGIEGELLETRIVREEDGKFVGFGGGEIDINEVGRTDHSAHVGIEMGEVNTAGQSFIDLGMHFGLDVGHFGVSDEVGSGQRKIAIGIEETGAFGLSGHGGPAVTGPIGVEGKMDAEVGVGMGFGPLRDFREPRAGDEDAGGSDPMAFEGFFGGGVDAVHHAEIIRVDGEQAGIGRIPRRWARVMVLLVGWVAGCCAKRGAKRGAKKRDTKASEAKERNMGPPNWCGDKRSCTKGETGCK